MNLTQTDQIRTLKRKPQYENIEIRSESKCMPLCIMTMKAANVVSIRVIITKHSNNGLVRMECVISSFLA